MLNYNPIASQPQHTHGDKLLTEKMMAHDPQLKQAVVDMNDKAIQGLREFPADSAFISDEAKRAFKEKEELRRRRGDYLKEKKEKKRQNQKYRAYEEAQRDEQA